MLSFGVILSLITLGFVGYFFYHNPDEMNKIKDYQYIIAGILALCGGIFTFASATAKVRVDQRIHDYERTKAVTGDILDIYGSLGFAWESGANTLYMSMGPISMPLPWNIKDQVGEYRSSIEKSVHIFPQRLHYQLIRSIGDIPQLEATLKRLDQAFRADRLGRDVAITQLVLIKEVERLRRLHNEVDFFRVALTLRLQASQFHRTMTVWHWIRCRIENYKISRWRDDQIRKVNR